MKSIVGMMTFSKIQGAMKRLKRKKSSAPILISPQAVEALKKEWDRNFEDLNEEELIGRAHALLLEKQKRLKNNLLVLENAMLFNADFTEYDEAIVELSDWNMLVSEFEITTGIKYLEVNNEA